MENEERHLPNLIFKNQEVNPYFNNSQHYKKAKFHTKGIYSLEGLLYKMFIDPLFEKLLSVLKALRANVS